MNILHEHYIDTIATLTRIQGDKLFLNVATGWAIRPPHNQQAHSLLFMNHTPHLPHQHNLLVPPIFPFHPTTTTLMLIPQSIWQGGKTIRRTEGGGMDWTWRTRGMSLLCPLESALDLH